MDWIRHKRVFWVRLVCCLFLSLVGAAILHGVGILQPVVYEDDERMKQIPNTDHVGAITNDVLVEQTFLVEQPTLSSITIRIATFDGFKDSMLTLSLADESTHELIQEWHVATKNYVDNSFLSVYLEEPLQNAQGRMLRLSITSDASVENAITVWTTESSYYEGVLQIDHARREDQLLLIFNIAVRSINAGYGWTVFFLFLLCFAISYIVSPQSRKRIVTCINEVKRTLIPYRKKIIYILLAEALLICLAFFIEWFLSQLFSVESMGLIKQSRIICIWVAGTLAIGIAAGQKTLKEQPEILSVLVLLLIGTVYAASLPAEVFVSWDEETHYSRTLALANCIDGKMSVVDKNLIMKIGLKQDWRQIEEFCREQAFLEQIWRMGGVTAITGTNLEKLWTICYLPSAIGVKLATLLQLPHRFIFYAGGYANLLVYAAAVFFGMRKLKSGKMIVAVVAMLPTPLFLAVRYGYDIWLISGFLLGTCYFIGSMQSQTPISKKEALITLGAFFVASFAKAVYFPVLSLLWLIPKQRFENPEWSRSYRCMICASMAMLAAGMVLSIGVLPFIWIAVYVLARGICWVALKFNRRNRILISIAVVFFSIALVVVLVYRYVPSLLGIGDLRGGDVNAEQQFIRILQDPLGYIKLVGEFLITKYFSYSSAQGWVVNVGFLAYVGISSLRLLPVLLLTVVAITDKNEWDTYPRVGMVKAMAFVLIIITAAMVATTMYIDFTPLGEQDIAGCQPRYLLPFFPLFFMVAGSPKITNRWNRKRYHAVILATSSFIAVWAIVQLVLSQYH